MQRGARDNAAVDHRWVELRHGRARAGAPHLHGHAAQDGGLLLWRELEGNGPARRLGSEAQLGLEGELVDLDNHAVDVIAQAVAQLERMPAEGAHLLLCVHRADVGVDGKPGVLQPVEQLVLARDGQLSGVCGRVDEG